MSLFFSGIDHQRLLVLIAVIGGYLSGSVPYGLIVGKLMGKGDVRKSGSGNIGATNVLRVAGKAAGAVTLVLDALKGFVPVAIAGRIHPDYAVMAALAAFVGHLFPVWLKFKGGKGVATAIGISFAFSWKIGAALCGIWLFVALVTQYSSLSALTAFGFAPFVALRATGDFSVTVTILVITVIIWVRHHENIRRLLTGKESKVSMLVSLADKILGRQQDKAQAKPASHKKKRKKSA